MLEFELLHGRSRAFVSLFPSRGSHPNMRPRDLKERRDTHVRVELRTGSPKGSDICSPCMTETTADAAKE